ncbi:MAG: hypothetical protein V4673_15325 [Pseudomonadota bacterium]
MTDSIEKSRPQAGSSAPQSYTKVISRVKRNRSERQQRLERIVEFKLIPGNRGVNCGRIKMVPSSMYGAEPKKTMTSATIENPPFGNSGIGRWRKPLHGLRPIAPGSAS